uniref:Apple domain-containing protein n=1 Tax=Bursaphelenchus xylophilus TaxID=6326 RepID=A0A1I7RNK5_BURXY
MDRSAKKVTSLECILASESRDSMAELYVDDSNGIYIHNKCVGKATVQPMTTTSTVTPIGLSTTQKMTEPTKQTVIQPSGYESPPNSKEPEEQPFDANPDQIFYGIQPPPNKAIPDEVIDSYGMVNMTEREETYRQVPVLPNNLNQKRLFDEAPVTAPKCFTRFRPLHVRSIRSTNTTTLEECTGLCLKCSSCLKGLKCEIAGFSRQFKQCVLAQTDIRWQIQSTSKLTDFVYFKRENC